MNKMKRFLGTFVVAFALAAGIMFGHVQVHAEGLEDLGKVVGGSVLTNDSEVTSTVYGRTRGTYLAYGTSSLVNQGGGQVAAGGATVAHRKCTLQYNVYIQRLEGETWRSVRSWRNTQYNSSLLAKDYSVSVERGYYYRTVGVHIAESESLSTITDGKWIG